MIPYTPIPSWKELASFATGSQLNDKQLAGPWRKSDEAAYWFSRAAWALEALSLYLNRINEKKNPTVWLPDYFCNGSLWPIRSTNAKIVFYPVGLDLEPKWDICQQMTETDPPDLLVLVHYFGAPANAEKASNFCKVHNALLVEDAAHAVGPSLGIGEYGDFILYSPYKLFPLPDGGLLLVRNKAAAELMPQIQADLSIAQPATGTWVLKKLVQKVMPLLAHPLVKRKIISAFDDDPPFVSLPRLAQLSVPARRMLQRCSQSMAQIGTQRIENARALRSAFKLDGQCTFWPGTETISGAPYRFALKFDDRTMAQRCFNKLNLAGIPAESWPDLPPEINKDVDLHEHAIKMRQTVVFLPVHQSLKIAKFCSICSSLSPF